MEFKANWKIFTGLGILFITIFYAVSDNNNNIQKVKLQDDGTYTDFELAEVSKLTKNKLVLTDIADIGAHEVLGRKTTETTILKPNLLPKKKDNSKVVSKGSNENSAPCGSSKNLECIPSQEERPSSPNLKKVSSKASTKPAESRPPRKKAWTSDDARAQALIAMGSGNTQTIQATSSIADSDKYIKKGSKYYGFIDERIEVYKGGKPQFINIYITGQGSPNATQKPFALYAQAKWAEGGVEVEVLSCISIEARHLSIECEGQVSDAIKGGRVLDAKIYNPSRWGKLLQIAANIAAGSHLDQLRETVTPNGQILSFANSNRVQKAMADAWIEAGKEAKRMFTGDRGEVAAGALVKILIKKDVRLW